MAHRSRSRKIDNLRWLGFSGTFSALSAGTAAINVLTASTMKDTVMRTRGTLVAHIDGAAAPAKLVLISLGLIIVPEGTGTTVLWSPFTDANAPWFWHTTFAIGYEEMVTDVIDIPVLSAYREVIDSKAMRKGPPDTEVQLVIENTTLNGAVTVQAAVYGRILLGN